jgi:cytosine/creatinine deaminase
MFDLIIKKVIIPGTNNIKDMGIKDGKISVIEDEIFDQALSVINAEKKLVVPGFVNIHTHLEKTLTYDKNVTNNTLEEAISVFAERFKTTNHEDIFDRASRALEMAIVNGTTAMRTHPMVDKNIRLTAVEALNEVRKKYKKYIDIQIAAMFGMEMSDSGLSTESIKLLEKACESGIDLLGGAPTLCKNPYKIIDQVFDIAKAYDKQIDLHIDEMDKPSSEVLEYLADKTIKENFYGKVTAGHCCSLSAVSDDIADRVIKKVREAGITITTLPTSNSYLMGRNDKQPVRRGLTRVKELMNAGVNVCYAGDNVRDPFVPFGNEDMLEEGLFTAKLLHMGTYEQLAKVFNMGTYNPARTMGLKDYGIEIGCQADLVILDAIDVQQALITQATKNYVIKNGEVVASTQKTTNLNSALIDNV